MVARPTKGVHPANGVAVGRLNGLHRPSGGAPAVALHAVLLAAGEGRRMATDGIPAPPKCLLSVGGRSLLDRHCEALAGCGVRALHVVVGYRPDEVWATCRRAAEVWGIESLERLDNADFRSGSIVSLARAGGLLGHTACLVMDADVLYPVALLRRLVDSPYEDCVLLDAAGPFDDEQMRLGVDDSGRVRRLERGLSGAFAVLGENVGFMKLGIEGGRRLARAIAIRLTEGRLDDPHEVAIDDLLATWPVGFEPVAPHPWTEIDSPGDLERARREVLPRL